MGYTVDVITVHALDQLQNSEINVHVKSLNYVSTRVSMTKLVKDKFIESAAI